MILSAQVRLLVRNNVRHILFAYMKREVDPRLDDAEDKGRGYVLALIDVIPILRLMRA